MAGGLSLLVVFVLSSCMLAGGQNCSLTSGRYKVASYIYRYMHALVLYPDVCSCFIFTNTFMHAVTQFHFFIVTASAGSVGDSTPGVRVTWNTTVPPECVTSVRMEFRTSSSHGPVVANYTTTNTSQTEVIQTGLQCATSYYIRMGVTGEVRPPGGMIVTPTLSSKSDVQIFIGGKETVCM